MTWRVEFTEEAEKQFLKLDKYTQRVVAAWIDKHLAGTENPRATGKPSTANRKGQWRYRIGDYRMLCRIEDDRIVIVVIAIGHRREVYG